MGEVGKGIERNNAIFDQIDALDQAIPKHKRTDKKISNIVYLKLTGEEGNERVEVRKKGIFRRIQHFFQKLTARGEHTEQTARKAEVIGKLLESGVENVTKRLSSSSAITRQMWNDLTMLQRFGEEFEDFFPRDAEGGGALKLESEEEKVWRALSEKIKALESNNLGEGMRYLARSLYRSVPEEKIEQFVRTIKPVLDKYVDPAKSRLDKELSFIRAYIGVCREKGGFKAWELNVINGLITSALGDMLTALSSDQMTAQVREDLACFQKFGEELKAAQDAKSLLLARGLEMSISKTLSTKINTVINTVIQTVESDWELARDMGFLSNFFNQEESFSKKMELFFTKIRLALVTCADKDITLSFKKQALKELVDRLREERFPPQQK